MKMKKKRNYDNLKTYSQQKEETICIYKNCTHTSETVKKRDLRRKEIVFFPFPNPDSNLTKFHKWMILSDIEDAQIARKVTSSICSEHFRDGRPTRENPDPISHDDQTANSTEPRKLRQLPPRKYAGRTIVIDDEQASLSESASTPKAKPKPSGEFIETLQLQYWAEDLSPAQLEMVQKRQKEYTELMSKLETLSKQNGGECAYKGDTCTAYQFNSNPPGLTLFTQANGATTTQTKAPTPSGPELPNVMLSNKPAAGTTVAPTGSNTYKLVMDPRLGLIVGTMTPTTAPVTPPSHPRRGRPVSSGPLQALQKQFGQSPATKTVTTTTPAPAPAPPVVRPTESTAVGGLATGTPAAKNAAPAIVDLTTDDGRPPPDSREVAFNKLQGKTFPSLVVVARPHLHTKEAATVNDRSMLDTKVKSVLVHTPTKFTEWLIQQGLIRSEQHCTIHPGNKLNLGMYSDVSKFQYSGGYVWISECCPHRFVSVFSGSLFEGAAHPPTVLLKLLYHWSCQTNIQNVVQWVKVDNLYVKGLFTWLRAVCSFALQQHLTLMGGPGKRIEVGVISLGTTSQDGSQRQVKVEVLGILDTELRLIRLRAVEPLADGERNYKRRFSKILEPLRAWVHPDSTIATDLTVDKGTLHFMGFANIVQNTPTGVPGNQAVMEYLRKIVPRMFQNTLSLLSRQIIQQFLDELVWREWFGQTAAQTFNNMVIHMAEQTRMNVGESLIQRLNKIAANPFKNHALIYQPQASQKVDPTPIIKRYGRKRTATNTLAVIDLDKPSTKRLQVDTDVVSKEAMVPLESYYYGSLEGDPNAPLAQPVLLNVRCCVCQVPYTNNISLLNHLLAHAHNMGSVASATQCRYCLAALPSVEELNSHIGNVHPVETQCGGCYHCLLCETQFVSLYSLGKHMSREHVPQELPYQCGTCGYRTSSHRHAVDHFYSKHDGATTLQCPFCLKSTAVWSSGRILSTNVRFFLAHLQKHQKKTTAKKCNFCSLWFIQKETLKEHQQKAHMSCTTKKGIKCWPLPNNYALVPKSKRFELSPSLSGILTIPAPVEEEEEVQQHQLTLMVEPDVTCVECGEPADTPGHFPCRASCDSCRYVTDCAAALIAHRSRCSSDMPRSPLTSELHCCCGYSSDCGNKMAKHLALCERKTAYPTAECAKLALATDHNSHSMLDVLGLVRKQDEAVVTNVTNVTNLTKYCSVPQCQNDSELTPNKYFLTFPYNKERKAKWLEAINLIKPMNSTKLFVCEDHFCLEDDAENWMYFKTIGNKIILKKDVVPHRNIQQSEPDVDTSVSQISDDEKIRKQKTIDDLKAAQENDQKNLDLSDEEGFCNPAELVTVVTDIPDTETETETETGVQVTQEPEVDTVDTEPTVEPEAKEDHMIIEPEVLVETVEDEAPTETEAEAPPAQLDDKPDETETPNDNDNDTEERMEVDDIIETTDNPVDPKVEPKPELAEVETPVAE